MKVVESITAVGQEIRNARQAGLSIGFVPTMGALHAGHLSLMEQARRDQDFVTVSIFVNPTQFAPHEDLQKYPRPRERDLRMCAQAGVDLVFYPSIAEVYGDDSQTWVTVGRLTELWEGKIRPGHFRGVTTIVAKLFHIVPADVAYFGQKDYQQQAVIRKMVGDLNFPIEIRTCPTVRDPDGLAMSSRNAYLTTEERHSALCLSRALREGEALYLAGGSPADVAQQMQDRINMEAGVTLQYASVVDPQTLEILNERQSSCVALVACQVGGTRLIDNAIWTLP